MVRMDDENARAAGALLVETLELVVVVGASEGDDDGITLVVDATGVGVGRALVGVGRSGGGGCSARGRCSGGG